VRLKLFATVLCLAPAGCQTFGLPWSAQPPSAPRWPQQQGPSVASGNLSSPAALPPAVMPPGAQTIQPVQHLEPVPISAPEPLPAGSLKPVTLGALTLADLEQMALVANPSVARAAALVQAARGNWVQVGLPPNPTVGYLGQQIGSRGLAEQDGVYVDQQIVRGRKLGLNREVAAQEIFKAEHQLAAQQQRVVTDVRIAFFNVLLAERQQSLTNELLDLWKQGLTTAEALLRGKEVGRGDVVQAQIEVGNAEILSQNAANRYKAAWQALATVVGDPMLPAQPLAGNVEDGHAPHDWDSSLQKLLSSSPEIAAAMADIERSRWTLERASVEKVPNLLVNGLVNWRDNGIGGRSDGALQVGVPLPLWNRNQGGIVQAQGEVAAAERALQQLELSLQNRLAPVYERYANALNQVSKYRSTLLPAAKDSLGIVRNMYQAGETGYVNLLTAQRTYSQTNLNYMESLRELRQAEAEIDGLLLMGSLDSK